MKLDLYLFSMAEEIEEFKKAAEETQEENEKRIIEQFKESTQTNDGVVTTSTSPIITNSTASTNTEKSVEELQADISREQNRIRNMEKMTKEVPVFDESGRIVGHQNAPVYTDKEIQPYEDKLSQYKEELVVAKAAAEQRDLLKENIVGVDKTIHEMEKATELVPDYNENGDIISYHQKRVYTDDQIQPYREKLDQLKEEYSQVVSGSTSAGVSVKSDYIPDEIDTSVSVGTERSVKELQSSINEEQSKIIEMENATKSVADLDENGKVISYHQEKVYTEEEIAPFRAHLEEMKVEYQHTQDNITCLKKKIQEMENAKEAVVKYDGNGNAIGTQLENRYTEEEIQVFKDRLNELQNGGNSSNTSNNSDENGILGPYGEGLTTLSNNLEYVDNATIDIRSRIISHNDTNYSPQSTGEAGIVGAFYKASDYYGNVSNVLNDNINAEIEAIRGISQAIANMDEAAAFMSESTLSDGMSGLYSKDNSTIDAKADVLNGIFGGLGGAAKTAASASGKYDELSNILGKTPSAGTVGRISMDSLNQAVMTIVPNLEEDVENTRQLRYSLEDFSSAIGSSSVLQGGVWEDVKTNLTSYQNLLNYSEKAATFISDTIQTAMGMIASYITDASSSINAMLGSRFSNLAGVNELDDSKLPEITMAIVEIQENIITLESVIRDMENAKVWVADYVEDKEGNFIVKGGHWVPKYTAGEIQPFRDQLAKFKIELDTLKTYKNILEGYADVVARAQDLINDALSMVKQGYENPVMDVEGNYSFNDNFTLDLSAYGLDPSKDYKQIIQDYYNSVLSADTPNYESTDEAPGSSDGTSTPGNTYVEEETPDSENAPEEDSVDTPNSDGSSPTRPPYYEDDSSDSTDHHGGGENSVDNPKNGEETPDSENAPEEDSVDTPNSGGSSSTRPPYAGDDSSDNTDHNGGGENSLDNPSGPGDVEETPDNNDGKPNTKGKNSTPSNHYTK